MAQEKDSPMIAKGIKKKIFSIMSQQGLTLSDLAQRVAEKTGNKLLNKNTLSARINGNPTLKGLYEVADALGVKIVDLFPEEEKEVVIKGTDLFNTAQKMVKTDAAITETKATPEAQQSLQSVAFCPHCGAKVRVGVVLMAD